MSGGLRSYVETLVSPACYDEFFVKYNFFHGGCLKTLLSKCLGYGIILGSILVKVPQIIKILRAKSAEGINLFGVTLELIAVGSTLAYGFANGFPFSAYGEAVFLFIQTWIIAFLMFSYNGQTTNGLLYSGFFGAALSYLMSGMAPADLLWFLQAAVMPNVAIGRLLQAHSNWKNGSTGQLAAITVFLLFAGSVARVFTSWQETGDSTLILTYAVSSACNGIIAAQMIYYWNAPAQGQAAGARRSPRRKKTN